MIFTKDLEQVFLNPCVLSNPLSPVISKMISTAELVKLNYKEHSENQFLSVSFVLKT